MTTDERLERVEGELASVKRRYRLLLIVVLLGAGVITAVTINPKNSIRASEFVLIDENGKARATLHMIEGGPNLFLYDENGKGRVSLCAWDEPSLNLFDEEGVARVSLDVLNYGPSLDLYDENGKRRVGLVLQKKIGPGLSLFDEKGTVRALLGAGQTITPDGKVVSYPESSLVLFGADENVIWQAP